MLYVSDINGIGSGPVLFTQPSSSTLTYTFTTLDNTADNVEFFGGATPAWTYVPVPGTDGCDLSVTNLRIKPQGTFVGNITTPNPSFQLAFRVCVK